MNMQGIDWAIIGSLLALMFYAAWHTKRYNRSVADFLAANRCARKYMLGVAEGIACVGAISIIGMFEMYYRAGFSMAWWGIVMLLAQVVVSMTGWVAYRYRQTRAMTLAQLLEMRYSRRFRVFAGIVLFISGTLNFGIFPAVGARFFQHFCGFNPFYAIFTGQGVKFGGTEFLQQLAGTIGVSYQIDLVYAAIMFALLSVAIYFTFAGGQITVMVTDFIQGSFFNIALCAVVVFLFFKVPWSNIVEVMRDRPVGQSLFHPFDASNTKDYNLWYFLIQAFGIFYTFMAWQGNQGYYASALNAHEARMGRILGSWRILTQNMLVLLIPIAAYTVLHHAAWTETAALATNQLDAIGDQTLREQLTTTVVLTKLLPAGLVGAFAGVMLAAFISTHDTYLHSWGVIFVQDIILPFRKKPFTKKQHIRVLRWAIFGVAVFIFFWSLFFGQNDTIYMYFALTGTMWLGGAGAVIVGALYWKRGTTGGAYGALIVGILLALIGFFVPRYWADWNHTIDSNRTVYLTFDKDRSDNNPDASTLLRGKPERLDKNGKWGEALNLTQKDAALELATPTQIKGVSFWFKTEQPGTILTWGKNNDIVLGIEEEAPEDSDNNATSPKKENSATYNLILVANNQILQVIQHTTLIKKNNWTHVALVFEKEKLTLYLNGKPAKNQKDQILKLTATPPDGPIWLGAYAARKINFNGQIDEISLYSKTLTPDAIATLKGADFPINSQWIWLIAMVCSTVVYVLISLIQNQVYEMDKLFHRGKYALSNDQPENNDELPARGLQALIGMGKEFNTKDKAIYLFVTGWTIAWAIIFLVGTLWNSIKPWGIDLWIGFWHYYILLALVVGVVTTIWFLIGGLHNLFDLFKRLDVIERNDADDGTVIPQQPVIDQKITTNDDNTDESDPV